MKRIALSLFLFSFLATAAGAQEGMKKKIKEVKPVATIDLNRYMGKWHEIARFPNWFQKHCISQVTAEYQLLTEDKVKVTNRCRKEDGQIETAVGMARPVGSGTKAKLKVSFSPAWMSWLPMVWGDYWIIALAPDYTYAVVGVPGRKYLWILSRENGMKKEVYEQAVQAAAAQGFDVSKLVMTKQAD